MGEALEPVSERPIDRSEGRRVVSDRQGRCALPFRLREKGGGRKGDGRKLRRRDHTSRM